METKNIQYLPQTACVFQEESVLKRSIHCKRCYSFISFIKKNIINSWEDCFYDFFIDHKNCKGLK
jgi:hypothetical protein